VPGATLLPTCAARLRCPPTLSTRAEEDTEATCPVARGREATAACTAVASRPRPGPGGPAPAGPGGGSARMAGVPPPAAASQPAPLEDAWVVDLDGVVWLAEQPIAGSAEAVALLRRRGVRVLFATNNSAPTVAQLVGRLAAAGIEAGAQDLLTSAQAAASMLPPRTSAFACAEGGVVEALEARGVALVAPHRPPPSSGVDAVVVGWTRRFDFDLLAESAALVRRGARLIGTNEDATFPTPGGLLPGAGALLSAVATAAQTSAEVAGKPHTPMVELVRRRVGQVSVVVGDRPSTDGLMARRLGARFALVRSGVTGAGNEPMAVEPDEEAPRLVDLVARWRG
jgi:HAD superfamily hydrolase (TIGR01450 family)